MSDTLRHEQCWKCKKFDLYIRKGEGKIYYVKTIQATTENMFGSVSGIPITYQKLSLAETKFREEMEKHKRGCTKNKHVPGFKFQKSQNITKVK